MRLLIVEDDRDLAKGLANSLTPSGFITEVVHTGHNAIAQCQQQQWDAIILDLGLPDLDGLSVLRKIRRYSSTPVLILTARCEVNDRVDGLDAGGDDYLAKPFALRELEARLRALLRRANPQDSEVRFGDIRFDTASRETLVGNKDPGLTARELATLELLLQRPGRVVSKSRFIDALYDASEEINPSMIEVHISRLRKKLGDAGSKVIVRALRGLGYRLEYSETHE